MSLWTRRMSNVKTNKKKPYGKNIKLRTAGLNQEETKYAGQCRLLNTLAQLYLWSKSRSFLQQNSEEEGTKGLCKSTELTVIGLPIGTSLNLLCSICFCFIALQMQSPITKVGAAQDTR